MRRVVGAIALLVIAFFLVFFIPSPASPLPRQMAGNASAQAQFTIRSAEIADAGAAGAGGAADAASVPGDGKVAVLRLSLYSDSARNLSAFCSPLQLQNNVLILSFPSAPGVGKALPSEIAAALSRSGISSREALLQDALSSENSIIISPAGALPLPLLQNASELEGKNTRVIALEALPGKTIDEGGNLAAMNGSIPQNFELVRLSPEEGDDAAAETVGAALFLPGISLVRASALQGNVTLAVQANSSEAYCRAICALPGGNYRFSDSGKLVAPPGSLIGPSRLASGQAGIYEFSLPENGEVGRSLRFFAVAYLPGGEAFRREIAGGEIKQGWASQFSLNFSRGGAYSVRVIDQFARVHASAFVQVPNLEVLPVSQEGSRYEFLAMLDGMPVEGAISARLDNGTPRNYTAHGGTFVVWASPAQGSHEMEFAFSGSRAAYAFAPQESGMGALLGTYLRFGVPAAIFVLAVFLLFRAGSRAKYSITFPETLLFDPEVVEVGTDELLSAWAAADRKFGGFCLPCYPDEVAAELSRGNALHSGAHGADGLSRAIDGRKALPAGAPKAGGLSGARSNGGHAAKPINAHSVLRILRKLSQQGVFSEHEGAFVPRAKMGGFSARELSMLRTIHECMLERGLRFSRKALITVKKGELELALFRGRGTVLSSMGRACRAVVFESRGELEKFRAELAVPDAASSRIHLALGNDLLVFVVASRNGLGGFLP